MYWECSCVLLNHMRELIDAASVRSSSTMSHCRDWNVDDIQVFCGLTHLEGALQGLEPRVG
jgi:hypothetical protein